jgi:simple sugar transport system permease protein
MLLLLFNACFTPHFFEFEVRDDRVYGSVIDILDNAAPLVLISLGMALVIGTGGIDLSVGAVAAIAGTIAAGLISGPDYSVLSDVPRAGAVIAILSALLGAALAGAVNGGLVAFARIQPIIATLILMVAGRGVAQLLSDGQVITFHDRTMKGLTSTALLGLPLPFFLWLAAFVLCSAVTRMTALGLFIESIGDNAIASRFCGVPAASVRFVVYMVCGVLAGLAGLLIASDVTAADAGNAGLYIELDAILAVVIGGTALTGGRFSLAGAVIGALLIQSMTTTILSRNVPAEYTLLAKAIIVILVILLQSERARALVRSPRLVRSRSAA